MRNHFILLSLSLSLVLAIGTSSTINAQTSVSGSVTEAETGEPLIGVNIVVKNQVVGTITNIDGNFDLSIQQSPPFTLRISMIGFVTQEIDITESEVSGLALQLSENVLLGQEIVISASRIEEGIMQSPVTVEKMDILAIQQSAAPNFFESLSHIKGVTTSTGSLTFNSINTRGFATIANVRFVTLVDGMDISAPLLNFPTGNLIGISELDAESVELVPGAASALYGPNAFNGILFMNSKSPFDYQGFSAQMKIGVTDSDAGGTDGLYNFGFRYAKAYNNRFAFKVNFNILTATDWIGNDYTTDRVIPGNPVGAPNFDGLNTYGDEFVIAGSIAALTGIPELAPLGDIDIRRRGFKEEVLLDSRDAKSIKADVALHYRLNDKVEALYNYRFGLGSSIYQGSAKFVLRDFTQQFHKLEFRGDNFFVRAYHTQTDDGDSYNMDALGIFTNERISPSVAEWVPTYLGTYVAVIQGLIPGVPGGDKKSAHDAARFTSDFGRNNLTPAELQRFIEATRNANLQIDENGAGFIEGSRLFHAEFNYNFKNQVDWAELQVGGNFRRYSIYSAGTIFDENMNEDGTFDRVNISEWGAYFQIGKQLGDLKLTGSLRYDKNENFDGQVNPRLSAVYSVNANHYLRASFQTGFRNPDSQAQFIWFPTAAGVLVGSTIENAERYGIHSGSGGAGALDPVTLQPIEINYVEPEELTAYEIGYKGLIADQVLVDINYYHNNYKNFIANRPVLSAGPVERRGEILTNPIGGFNILMNPYVNVSEDISSDGIGVGLTWNIGNGYILGGSYNWAVFTEDEQATEGFLAGFNTPEHKLNFNFSNRNIGNNIGFYVGFRWQDDFLWESTFGQGTIPEYGVLDLQLNYKIEAIKSVVKVGGTNLFSGDYRTNIGAGFVGSQYYVALTFDQFLN